MNFRRNFAIQTFFWSWALVGTLDITGASINYFLATGKNPVNILVYIASGIFGAKAFEVGAPTMAIVGLALHYFIAGTWTLIFFVLYSRVDLMRKNWLASGIGFGILIWTVMSQVVVRLSNTPKGPFNLSGAIVGAAILCVAIGIPLALIARRYHRRGGQ